MFWILTVLHFLVDASSVTVLAVGGFSVQRLIAYNVLAFALQLPLGIVSDRFPWITRSSFFISGILLLSGLLTGALVPTSSFALVLVCVGNAVFHLSAGRHVLETEGFRAGPVGLFISTGAVGLACGMLGAEEFPRIFMPCLSAALATAYVLAFCIRSRFIPGSSVKSFSFSWKSMLCLLPLCIVIIWRSWAGLFAHAMVSGEAAALAIAAAVVTLLGKIAGGYIGDRVGHLLLTCVSVVGSLVLVAMPIAFSHVLWLIVLFVAQLATGPVIHLLRRNMGDAPGTAFGFNSASLLVGSFI